MSATYNYHRFLDHTGDNKTWTNLSESELMSGLLAIAVSFRAAEVFLPGVRFGGDFFAGFLAGAFLGRPRPFLLSGFSSSSLSLESDFSFSSSCSSSSSLSWLTDVFDGRPLLRPTGDGFFDSGAKSWLEKE